MFIRSREEKSNRVTIAINARTGKEEEIIKRELRKALSKSNRLLENEISYEIYTKFSSKGE